MNDLVQLDAPLINSSTLPALKARVRPFGSPAQFR
jgi:hypothetical protein